MVKWWYGLLKKGKKYRKTPSFYPQFNSLRTGKSTKQSWLNQRTKWPFSIAMLNYQRVYIKYTGIYRFLLPKIRGSCRSIIKGTFCWWFFSQEILGRTRFFLQWSTDAMKTSMQFRTVSSSIFASTELLQASIRPFLPPLSFHPLLCHIYTVATHALIISFCFGFGRLRTESLSLCHECNKDEIWSIIEIRTACNP